MMSLIPSLAFTITWQFAQFALFLQTLIIFGLSLIGILDKDKVSY